jgi:alpha-1,2-mannosyltransferase
LLVNHGGPLYSAHLKHGLGFTYPPFAILLFLPLIWLPMHAAAFHSAQLNIVLAAVAVHGAMRLARRRPPVGRETAAEAPGQRRWSATPAAAWRWIVAGGSTVGWLAAAAALWLEPISSTIGYGQVDLLITVLVIVDLAYLRQTRASGIGIGIAAALKLTPLIFIPYLLFTRRGRAAARALATVALSIVVSFVALPRDASVYWGGKFLDLSRVTGSHHRAGSGPINQSLRGAVLRLFPTLSDPRTVWLLAALVVGVAGLAVAARAGQRGDEPLGFLLTAVTGLLISPVSWTHHWAIAVPGVLALIVRGRGSAGRAVVTALALAFAVDGYAIWWLMVQRPVPLHLGAAELLIRNLYVVGGVGVIAVAVAAELGREISRRRPQVPALDTLLGARPAFGRSQRAPHPRPVPQAHVLTQARPITQPPAVTQPLSVAQPPTVAQPLSVTQPQPQLAAAGPGHPGATLRAITTSQPGAADRQSLR